MRGCCEEEGEDRRRRHVDFEVRRMKGGRMRGGGEYEGENISIEDKF